VVSVCDLETGGCRGYPGMSSDTLRKLQDWVTIDEAATELSAALSHRVSTADILRLLIDKHLKLAIYLPEKVPARCHRTDDEATNREIHREIQGVCDVPMLDRAKSQVEHDYHWQRDGLYVPIARPLGASVEWDGFICQLPPDRGESGMFPRPPSEFPQGSVLAIRRSMLESFIRQHAPTPSAQTKEVADKPLGARERATLLTIIAAFAKALAIDVSKASKAAEAIEAITIDLGIRIPARTIEGHLKRIPDAIQRRSRTSA
jgi:hypothetical protein